MPPVFTAIQTPRLILRVPQPTDLAPLIEMLTDPVTMSRWPQAYTAEQITESMDRNNHSLQECGFGRCAIAERESGVVVADAGIVQLTVNDIDVYDLGYIVHHPYWRQGYGTEIALALLEYGFSRLNVGEIHANMAFDNIGSRRVAEKVGMRKIGEFHNERNREILTLLFRITQNEWAASRNR